jgi:hypothetical protein
VRPRASPPTRTSASLGGELEHAGRGTCLAAVDRHAARHRQHDLQPSGQWREFEHAARVALAGHLDGHAERPVALLLGDERVRAGTQQETAAEAQPGQAALERQAFRLRRDVDLHGHRGEEQRGQHGQRDEREPDREAPA